MKVLNKIFYVLIIVIILALIINIIADEFSFDDIWNHGWFILFLLSVTINVYLILHLVIIYRKIPESDKLSFQRIMKELNLNSIERILYTYESNLGFTDDESIMIEKFLYASKHIGNKIYNKRLNLLLYNFIKTFNEYYQCFSDNACSKNGRVRIYPEMKINEPIKYSNLISRFW